MLGISSQVHRKGRVVTSNVYSCAAQLNARALDTDDRLGSEIKCPSQMFATNLSRTQGFFCLVSLQHPSVFARAPDTGGASGGHAGHGHCGGNRQTCWKWISWRCNRQYAHDGQSHSSELTPCCYACGLACTSPKCTMFAWAIAIAHANMVHLGLVHASPHA